MAHNPYLRLLINRISYEEIRRQLELLLEDLVQKGWGDLVTAIRQILQGERDRDILCQDLHYFQAMIVYAILDGIANPETLKRFTES